MIELDFEVPLEAFSLKVQLTSDARAIAVMGTSGAGKTTLLEALAGLRRRAKGRMVVDAEVLMDSERGLWLAPERRRVGYVPQDSMLFPHLTAEQNIRFAVAANAAGRVTEAIELLQLGSLLGRRPETLSGGERQRVALARALAIGPRLLLLDEPLAALDLELKGRIIPYLLKVRDELKVPFLYVTHQPGEAQVLAEELVVLGRGAVLSRGPPAQLFSSVLPQRYENILDGRVESIDPPRLRLGSSLLLSIPHEPGLKVGARVGLSVAADDVLVSTHPLKGISARNVFPATVTAMDALADAVWVRCEAGGVPWVAKLTAEAVKELPLENGSAVYLVLKTHSLHRL
jgi:molybdate transport system ATP-binding protein